MVQKRIPAAVILLLLSIPLCAEKLPKPDRLAGEPTPEERVLISEGIRLHDAGRYDEAIAKYKKILDQSPNVAGVMYELALTYYSKGDIANALETARIGTRYRSHFLPQLYMTIGNILDDQGKSKEAIALYRDAIDLQPDFALLHFNLGLSLVRNGNFQDAKASLQRSVVLDPEHASSHFVLATVYSELGYPVPTILALSRFLFLEGNTRRSQAALATLHNLIGGDVSRDPRSGQITIQMLSNGKSKKDEGDFDGIELGLSITTAAAQIAEPDKRSSPFQLLAEKYSTLAELLSNRKQKGFAIEYYGPFFTQLKATEKAEAFVYGVFRSEKIEGLSEWEQKETDRLHAFDSWLESYQWPKVKP